MKQNRDALPFLGGLTAEEFLRDYWQKRPLFVKGAFPHFKDPLTIEELAGLTLEEEIPSRLILEEGGEKPWELREGPFSESLFTELPEKKWMMILNDLEKHLPELRALLTPFRFIPNWRLDDLQASISADEGSVGAHWDDYDVFLLQGAGKKEWRISYDAVSEEDYIKGVDLRLMPNFKADERWIVEAGDLLYLPPRVGHYGRSIGKSITWSIGYRMAKINEMLDDFTHFMIEEIAPDLRLEDPERSPVQHQGELEDGDVERLIEQFKDHLVFNRERVARWFGEYITAPKMAHQSIPADEPYTREDIVRVIEEESDLFGNPGLHFLYHREGEGWALYVEGERYTLPLEAEPLIRMLGEEGSVSAGVLRRVIDQPESEALLLKLLNGGQLMDEGALWDEE